jgi:hypothetical protein
MIHRDNRKPWESASGLGQIVHREGPTFIAVGDVDLYVGKLWPPGGPVIRLIEQKQANQVLGNAQEATLKLLDKAIRAYAATGHLNPHHESGVFLLRGSIGMWKGKVNFLGRTFKVLRMDGSIALEPPRRKQLFDWLNCGPDWEPRKGQWRRW